MCIYFFLQKIEMLFKYMNKSIPNNQQTNDESKMMTTATATCSSATCAEKVFIFGTHLRDVYEVKHQISMLTNNFTEFNKDDEARFTKRVESRTMTAYGYILLPDYVSDAGANFIMQYKHGMEAKYVAKFYNLDYIWFDYDTRYLMFWGADREVQQAMDYFKWIIPSHEKMRSYPKPYYTKLQDREDRHEDRGDRRSKHS